MARSSCRCRSRSYPLGGCSRICRQAFCIVFRQRESHHADRTQDAAPLLPDTDGVDGSRTARGSRSRSPSAESVGEVSPDEKVLPEPTQCIDGWSMRWQEICKENHWIQMMFDTHSHYHCPKCKLCDAWIDDTLGHLYGSKCQRKRDMSGCSPGPLLQSLMGSTDHACSSKQNAPRSWQFQYGGDQQFHELCANPYCDLLVHSQGESLWGKNAPECKYCCQKCYRYHINGNRKKTAHGLKCEKRLARMASTQPDKKSTATEDAAAFHAEYKAAELLLWQCKDSQSAVETAVNTAIDGGPSSIHHAQLQELVSQRNVARSRALELLKDFIQKHSETKEVDTFGEGSRSADSRESYLENIREWLITLENAQGIDIEQELGAMKACRRNMRQAFLMAKDAAHELDRAAYLDQGQDEIDSLTKNRDMARVQANAQAKDDRKKMVRLIGLAKRYFPEVRLELVDMEKDYIKLNIQNDPEIWQVFDAQRELTSYSNVCVISRERARHVIYEALDLDGQPCIVKKIDWHHAKGLKAFVNEVKHLVKLQHPLMVPVQCFFIDNKNQAGYLQFERFECSLEEWMQRQAARHDPEPENVMKACEIIHTMIQAVSWIHSQDVVHGDIKPANFLWDSKKSLPRLHDFETACDDCEASLAAGRTTTLPDDLTWEYAAPELRDGVQSGNARKTKMTDAFALGCCINEVLKHLIRNRIPERDQLRDLASRMTWNDCGDRITVMDAEDVCRQIFHRTGHVEMLVVKCTDVRYTQKTCSDVFSTGESIHKLVEAVKRDPSYPLKCDRLTLEVVQMGRWLHSNDNRRLWCFKEAQKYMSEDIWIRIRKHTLPKTIERMMGRYNTQTDGKTIRLTRRSH
eukprot:TRINITY_DN38245_c0_g1_i1.p1 TRINITY_DN38245_c0_g1~~TRINITY_DN38245_c0_g1_i1.p1  ORF type:complete len:860 (-),score=118.22 TRINITY_DN38245_c0_g1_i1:25-2604(-)